MLTYDKPHQPTVDLILGAANRANPGHPWRDEGRPALFAVNGRKH